MTTKEETPAILFYHPWQAMLLVSQIENLSTVNCYTEAIQAFSLFTDTITANAEIHYTDISLLFYFVQLQVLYENKLQHNKVKNSGCFKFITHRVYHDLIVYISMNNNAMHLSFLSK
jgi:hypothetical protein